MILRSILTTAIALSAAGAAHANVKLVTPGAKGTYTNLPTDYAGVGVYGAEIRRGNNAINGDWELGVGNATSQAGKFNQGQFAWGSATHDFSAEWSDQGLAVTIGNLKVTNTATKLLGDALRIGAKRDATVTIANVDGVSFSETLNGSPGTGTANYLHFFSKNNWGGDGKVSFNGTIRIGGASGTGSASQVFFQNGDFAAVPEPATWAMMIGGFGMIGGLARRRAQVNVAFA